MDEVVLEANEPPRRLEAILKVSEVCNIACSYCYYYFSGDDRPLERPIHIQRSTISALIDKLNEAFDSGIVSSVQIDLHGGEPLMIGVDRFVEVLSTLSQQLHLPVRFCITTNGMLINERWIGAFEKFDVSVCLSIDGPPDVHDLFRKDKLRRPTHQRVMSGLELLNDAAANGRILPPSCLCVVTPSADGGIVYRYLAHELGISSFDFLMPDVTHDSAVRTEIDAVTTFMEKAFLEWLADDNPSINVRIFKSVLSLLVTGRSYLAGFGGGLPFAITVGSDGAVDGDDFLKPCGIVEIATNLNIRTSSIEQITSCDKIKMCARELSDVPDDCKPCEFAAVCKGGQATHRFSAAARFNNASVYCAVQKSLFSAGARHLIMTGVSTDHLSRTLLPNFDM